MLQLLVVTIVLYSPSILSQVISEKKCIEYGEAVYSGGGVIVGRKAATRQSSCAIDATPLIVGGTLVKEREIPHMAVIGYGMTPHEKLNWFCGGSLISDLYILTAAHCSGQDSLGQKPQKVRLGALNLDEVGEEEQERGVAEVIVHPDYKKPAKYHDIALVKMDDAVEFTPGVRPACLRTLPTPDDVDIIASGFGKTAYENPNEPNPALLKVQLKTVPGAECWRLLEAAAGRAMPAGLAGGQLCAGQLAGGKDTCQGDSGGPLQVARRQPACTYSVVGVTSFGRFCGYRNSPAVYTNVSAYVAWIEPLVWPDELKD